MSKIEERLRRLADQGEKALVCFLTAGDPNESTSEALIIEAANAGADVIEIGVPFSDPLADGPSIQAASERALHASMTPPKTFDLVRKVRERTDVPLVLMTYFNPVHKFGLERFAKEVASAGANGVIMTDLPPEEAREWKAAAESAGLDTIFLLAPTSTDDRIRLVAEKASGFIYCVSRTGVTGAQNDVQSEVSDLVQKVRRATSTPVVIGFGVYNPDMVRKVAAWADGAVVGSAIVDLIAAKQGDPDLLPTMHRFISELKQATR
jgi:tryptophan synthase alpha chain